MGVTTSSLHYGLAKNFYDLIPHNKYFVFGSSLTNTPESIDSNLSRKVFLEKTIFGKAVEPNDVCFGIRRVTWETGTIYTQYDDTIDLNVVDYFVVSEPGSDDGEYSVFKCISNNYGAESIEKPVYNEGIASQNYILRTSDGYVWKYMYGVSFDQVQTYATSTVFPVIADTMVSASATQGIDNIVVTNRNTNFGYSSLNGTIHSIGTSGTIYLDGMEFNPTRNFYSGYTFFTTSGDGITSRIYTIISSDVRVSDQRPYIVVEGYTSDDISNIATTTWSYSIVPSIEIVGDGTGAVAIPVIENTRITSVRIINSGQGYTRSIARVVKPLFGFNPELPDSGDVTCSLRVIIGPPSVAGGVAGHGGNPIAELNSRWAVIYSSFDASDTIIPDTNTYSKVGLVKSPVFTDANTVVFDNRIMVPLSSVNQLSPGDVVTQPQTGFRGIIHTIDEINNSIYITEFLGPYFDQTESPTIYLSGIEELNDSYLLSTPVGPVAIQPGGIIYPGYQQGTGEVLHIVDFDSIDRGTTHSERFKFVITF